MYLLITNAVKNHLLSPLKFKKILPSLNSKKTDFIVEYKYIIHFP